MTYNQKIWLGVFLLCTLFWVAVIGGACSLYQRVDRFQAHHAERVRRPPQPGALRATRRSGVDCPPEWVGTISANDPIMP